MLGTLIVLMFNQEEQQTHMHEVLPTEQLEQIHKVV
jgi:hypothetical protein